jgi:hypothetical protein
VQGDVPARRIRILVQGPPGQTLRALLSCIRHHFRTINAGLTPPEEYVPVPNLEAEPVRYGDLLARENQNRRTIEVTDRQSRVYDVEVTRLLNHYVPEADWTREAAELKAGLDGVHTRLDRMAGKMGSLTVPGQSLTDEEKALPPRPLPGAVPFYKSWNAMAVISGLGGALVAGGVPLPVWLTPWRWMIVLAAGVAVMLLVMRYDPATRFRRLFCYVATAAVAMCALGSIKGDWEGMGIKSSFSIGNLDTGSVLLLIFVLTAAGGLAWDEMKENRKP